MKVFFFLSIFLFSINTFSSEKSNMKIAVVNMDQVIENTKDFQKFNEKINTYIKNQNLKINKLKESKQKKTKVLDLNMLSAQGKESFNNENRKIDYQINEIVLESEKYIRDEEIKIKNKIIRRTIPIIKEYSDKNNLILTVDITSIVYDNKIKFLDISNAISVIYNSKY